MHGMTPRRYIGTVGWTRDEEYQVVGSRGLCKGIGLDGGGVIWFWLGLFLFGVGLEVGSGVFLSRSGYY
jgi:hypothetical protein